MIYHIASEGAWRDAIAQGSYTADSLKSEGFIHCSTRGQVLRVANRFYMGRTDLVLLAIEESRIQAQVTYENLEGGEEKFPHIYGPLNLEAIQHVQKFTPDETGLFSTAWTL